MLLYIQETSELFSVCLGVKEPLEWWPCDVAAKVGAQMSFLLFVWQGWARCRSTWTVSMATTQQPGIWSTPRLTLVNCENQTKNNSSKTYIDSYWKGDIFSERGGGGYSKINLITLWYWRVKGFSGMNESSRMSTLARAFIGIKNWLTKLFENKNIFSKRKVKFFNFRIISFTLISWIFYF